MKCFFQSMKRVMKFKTIFCAEKAHLPLPYFILAASVIQNHPKRNL